MLQGLKALYISSINVGDLRLPLFLRGDKCYTGKQRGATTMYIIHTTLHSLLYAALKKGGRFDESSKNMPCHSPRR